MELRLSTPSDHGLLVACVYWLFDKARSASFTNWWFRLGEWWGSHTGWWLVDSIFNAKLKRTTPHWQDIGAVLLAVGSVLIAVSSTNVLGFWSWLTLVILAELILLDMLIYYVTVMWFDDLYPGVDRRVWSFRRIVVKAVLNFTESILLFGVLYSLLANVPGSFLRVLFYSFVTATTLNLPTWSLELATDTKWAYILWSLQVALSLFFLVIVIAILAELGLTRGEIVGSSKQENKADT